MDTHPMTKISKHISNYKISRVKTHHRKQRRKNPNLLRPLRRMMLPIHLQRRLPNHMHHRQWYIFPRQTIMRPRAEDEPIFRVRFRVARDPAIGVEYARIGICDGVVQGGPT